MNRIKIVLCVAILLFSAQVFCQVNSCDPGGDQSPSDTIPPKRDPNPSGEGKVKTYTPVNPNEIIGTRGYDGLGDTLQWVATTASWPYTNILILQEKL